MGVPPRGAPSPALRFCAALRVSFLSLSPMMGGTSPRASPGTSSTRRLSISLMVIAVVV